MVGHERFCSLEQGCKPCPICNGTVCQPIGLLSETMPRALSESCRERRSARHGVALTSVRKHLCPGTSNACIFSFKTVSTY